MFSSHVPTASLVLRQILNSHLNHWCYLARPTQFHSQSDTTGTRPFVLCLCRRRLRLRHWSWTIQLRFNWRVQGTWANAVFLSSGATTDESWDERMSCSSWSIFVNDDVGPRSAGGNSTCIQNHTTTATSTVTNTHKHTYTHKYITSHLQICI